MPHHPADIPDFDALDDFAVRQITLLGKTKRTYVGGTGPAVIVMTEMPGISPHVARFARWVRQAGFTVYMPSLFGVDGAYPEAEAGLACDPGYDNWRLVLIHPSRKPLPGAPVEARSRVIRVLLPKGLSLIAFEKELHERLSAASLPRWISSPAGRRHCADLNLDPRDAIRLTGYNTGEGERVSRADELYIFKPRLDGGRLLTIIERIVHEFVVRDAANDRPAWGWVSVNQGYRRQA